ncbi:MAG: DNA repair protein RecN [Chloroherpetonaceae bacterium]|nr:DNA repair protein RecN [Chloroherpetonaceae bacterium]MDW8438680.1 DNA repair protein RecN [Chloroherpetonaceae bacterium]
MLKRLYVKNFALIDELTIEFGSGLNIITGETGAGKSILLGALGMVLGERASADVVRKGEEKAVIEAIIDVANNKRVAALLQSNEIETSDEMILRREISSKGARCFINDTPATLALLHGVGELCIDLHGQHEHQSLLKVESHIRLLDEAGGLGGLVEEYRALFATLKQSKAQLEELRQKEKNLREKRAFYEFQIKEIDEVAPEPDEWDALETEEKILENAEKIFSATNSLHEILYANDDSVHNRLVEARNILQDLSRIDKSFGEPASDAQTAQALVDEITKFVQRYNSRIDFNAERLEEIRERMKALSALKKKYGGTLADVLAYREKIGKEVELAENFEGEIAKWEKKIRAEQGKLSDIAERLSQKRRETAKRLSRAIVEELKKLGISEGRFEVRFSASPDADGDIIIDGTRYAANANGYDEIEFLISTNLGEDVKPLAKVASGGEISRVMLALKTVLAKADRLPILVFDEIDTGVSGKVAQAVGFSMKDLAKFHQIIAITHLPQIAALADAHFRASKKIVGERTVSIVERLSESERRKEIARLLSGTDITEAALKSAEELIEAGR